MPGVDADIIIVGGGIAGLTAANRAAQLGLTAVVLEKGSAERYLCNTRYTGGTLHVCMGDIMAGEKALFNAIERLCAGIARPDLAQAVARHAERAVRWLQGEGLKFLRASASPHHQWVLAPPGRTRPGLDWEGRAGDVLLRQLGSALVERGGKLIRDARARHPILEEGRCVGLLAELASAPTVFRARHVVLADGGFQSALDLVGKYICRRPETLHQRNAGSGTGDGLRFAQEAGAAIVGMDRFYGHLLSIDAPTNERLWPYPYLDALVTAGVLVGPDGKRFADEGRGGVYAANCVASLADPLSAAVIFDQAIWDGAGKYGLIPANPHLKNEGGTLHRAPNLGALARLIGVPPEVLDDTVATYNTAVDAGSAASLSPSRAADKGLPVAIRTPPYYAAPVCAGITYTMGGIAIDGHARVLRPDDSVIEGLYAAGAATGGLEGGSYAGYVGGLAKSVVTGLRAAEHAAGKPIE